MKDTRASGRRQGPARRPSRCGFSLMEVLLALVVITVGLYGILDLVTANQRLSRRSLRQAQAIELAYAKMAELRAAGFEALEPLLPAATDDASTCTLYPGAPSKFAPPYDSGPYVWQARFDRDGSNPEVVNVEVRVSWYPITGAQFHDPRESTIAVGALLPRR